MFSKIHEATAYFEYLKSADGRIELNMADKLALKNYLKGFIGEKKYFEMAQQCGGIKLWDISLKNPGLAQYDFIYIYDGKVYHLDIKNYSGEMRMMGQKFVTGSDYYNQDILSQLERADYYLKKFVKMNGFTFEVISRIVFINPALKLNNFNQDPRIVLPHQVRNIVDFFQKDRTASHEEIRLRDLLLIHHQQINPHERIAYYPFENMKKGIRCPSCRWVGMVGVEKKKNVKCRCGYSNLKSEVLKITIDEMLRLKNAPVTRKEIEDWTSMKPRAIQRVLKKYYKMSYSNKSTTFSSLT
ncbi:NERD domain-containing protein [Macrococcus hajekii]|uniref:NERD domain-containing protein n=1 Tax=Macrococcus hajekii TaxID=198482 RepID=A0A4R6BM58_9STAP|nr:nuclease-related domain-containing protein [Macrococcus hajekii]TDM02732.1 NERD domain-containing protein [Macrococcus hajekii]GGB03419.1 hypothetical protein GCM10007190_09310 [Macrococcus hajekii]